MTDLAVRCAKLCGFSATGPSRRTRKSELLPGEVDGAPAIAKRMVKPNVVWDWYFAHEVAVYRAFVEHPPSFAVPHVFAAADDVLVIERLPGALATTRRPYAELRPEQLAALLAMRREIAGYPRIARSILAGDDDVLAARSRPDPELEPTVRAQIARRLLENPTDPAWILEGLGRCHRRGLIDEDVLAACRGLADAPVAASHGDLLLRNAMQRVDGTLVLVDWECAGTHLAEWDLALLWSQLSEAGRAVVETQISGRAFFAVAVFALCRELVFLDAFRTPDDHAGRLRVEADLASATVRLLD